MPHYRRLTRPGTCEHWQSLYLRGEDKTTTSGRFGFGREVFLAGILGFHSRARDAEATTPLGQIHRRAPTSSPSPSENSLSYRLCSNIIKTNNEQSRHRRPR